VTTPAVEIEAKLKSDAALKTLHELREAMKRDFAEGAGSAKNSITGLGKSIASELGSMVSAVGIATLAFGALKQGVGAFVDFLGESISASMEAERAELQLVRVMQLRKGYTEDGVEALLSFNEELETMTTLDADNLIQVESTLASLGILEKDLKSVTLATIGFSEKFGKPLAESAQIVGKAIVENSDALRAFGIDAKDATDLVQKLAPAAAISAQKLNELEGRLTANKVAFGNLQETVGGIISKSDGINKSVEGTTRLYAGLTRAIQNSSEAITGFIDKAVEAASGSAKWVMFSPPVAAAIALANKVAGDAPAPDREMDYGMPIGPQPKIETRNRKADEEAHKARLAELEKRRKELQIESDKYGKEYEDSKKKYMTAAGKKAAALLGISDKAYADFLEAQAELKEIEKVEQETIIGYNKSLTKMYDEQREYKNRVDAAHADGVLNSRLEDLNLNESSYRGSVQAEKDANARRDEMRLDNLARIAETRKLEREAEEQHVKETREYWGQLASIGTNGINSMISGIAQGIGAGEKINFSGMFAGMLSSLGSAMIAMGSAAVLAGTLGTVAPIFAGPTGGPAGVAAGLALIAGGFGLTMAGGFLGKRSSGASGGGVASTSTGSAGGFGASGSTGSTNFGTPRGFQPDAVTEPKQTVINVSFQGLMAGTERGLAREVTRLIRTGGSLVPGGG
jgi:hypothetical protein